MKKLNILCCLFFIFSCNNQTQSFRLIPKVRPISGHTFYSNFYISTLNKELFYNSMYQNGKNRYYLIKNQSIQLNPEIVITTYIDDITKEYTERSQDRKDNLLSNFSFLSLDNNLIAFSNGKIEAKDKTGVFKVRVTYLPNKKYQDIDINVVNDSNELKKIITTNYFKSRQKATTNGAIYDIDNNPLNNVEIKIIFRNKELESYQIPSLITSENKYVIRNIPLAERLTIIASKKNYAIRFRNEILKDIPDDPLVNIYDFSGIYALQNEPEITLVEINGQEVKSSSKGDVLFTSTNKPRSLEPTIHQLSQYNLTQDKLDSKEIVGHTPDTTGLNSNINLKMCFSEDIDKSSFENSLRIRSQENIFGFDGSLTLDKKDFSFEWYKQNKFSYLNNYELPYDLPCTNIRVNRTLPTNKGGQEAKYLIDFTKPFKDLEGNQAIEKRYFRFSPSQMNDFVVFSVKNSG